MALRISEAPSCSLLAISMCLASDTENKVLGEQQADVPLEVKQQHLASHGDTDGRCKNNASKGGGTVLWSPVNDGYASSTPCCPSQACWHIETDA
jgi:hypothetical protein